MSVIPRDHTLPREETNQNNNNNRFSSTMPSYCMTVLWRRRRRKLHSSLIFVFFCTAYRNFLIPWELSTRVKKIIITTIDSRMAEYWSMLPWRQLGLLGSEVGKNRDKSLAGWWGTQRRQLNDDIEHGSARLPVAVSTQRQHQQTNHATHRHVCELCTPYSHTRATEILHTIYRISYDDLAIIWW